MMVMVMVTVMKGMDFEEVVHVVECERGTCIRSM